MKARGKIQGKFPNGRRFIIQDGEEIPEDIAKFMGLKKQESKPVEDKK